MHTRMLALAAALVAVLAGSLAGASPVEAAASPPLVIGHRGYTGTGCTENTACSISAAADHGADYAEFDVRFSTSDYPVILHDATVDRTTTGTGKVANMTVAQFTGLTTNDGGHPPTLWEALHAAQVGGIKSLVELKTTPTDAQWDNFMTKIPAGYKASMTIHSFISQSVWDARRHGFPMIRLLNYMSTADWTWAYDGINVPWTDVTAASIATEHAHGVPVYVWTADDPASWKPLADEGVDGIVTDADASVVKAALGGA